MESKAKNIKKTRVITIGIDGATLKIIEPMVRKGKLPNIKNIMENGAYGPLASTMPPITPCAWTSFVTGKEPYKHGLYDFILHKGDPNKKIVVNRTFIKAKSLWGILTDAGKKSIVIDVPMTYPPEKIKGIQISRIMVPVDEKCVYPKSLYSVLEKKHLARIGSKNKKNRKTAKLRGLSTEQKKIEIETRNARRFTNLNKGIQKSLRLAKWLMSNKDWDFFIIVFMATDIAGHYFWNDKERIEDVYEKIDRAIGQILRCTPDNTIKFLMSDHGFTKINYIFHINRWLLQKGLLSAKLTMPQEGELAIKHFMSKKKGKGETFKSAKKSLKFDYDVELDYSKTKVYLQSITSYGLRINLRGREKHGVVEKKDYEKFRNSVIRELKRLKNPNTKQAVFTHVLKREEVYRDDCLSIEAVPDIFLKTKSYNIWFSDKLHSGKKIFEKVSDKGNHHPQGVIFCCGEDIKKGKIRNAKITDIMPTILHSLNVSLPKDLDGKVLSGIFKSESQYARRKVTYSAASTICEAEKEYSNLDKEKVLRRLGDLGYLD